VSYELSSLSSETRRHVTQMTCRTGPREAKASGSMRPSGVVKLTTGLILESNRRGVPSGNVVVFEIYSENFFRPVYSYTLNT